MTIKEAIERYTNKADYESIYGSMRECLDFRQLAEWLKDYKRLLAQEPKWIPVSERLPEKSDYCLCCDKDGYMIIGWVSKWLKEWCFDDDEVDMDVVAWMPLPQPYKAESEE